MDFISKIFSREGFVSQGQSYLWSPEVFWPQLIGDLLTAIAYFIIPIGIYFFLQRRPNIKERRLFLLFGAFILACGITHLIDIITIWVPIYHLSAIIKLITGIISMITAITLIRILPQLIKLPTTEDLRSTQAALGQSQQTANALAYQLETITSLSPAIIYLYDLEKRENIYTNQSITTLLGYAETEVSKPQAVLTEAIFPEDLPILKNHHDNILPALQQDEIVSLEYRIRENDTAQYRWFRSQEKVFERSAEGEVKVIVGIASDITQEKASGIASLRKVNTALQQTQIELERFVYAVSHDLRAPIRHIRGYIEMMQEGANAKNTEAKGLYINKILKAATRLENMVEGLLQYSRNQNNPLHKKPISLQELTKEVREDFTTQIASANRKVEWEINNLPTVFADKDQIRQVLENLIGNALKYSANQEVSQIKIWSDEIDDLKWIHVSDNGVGFNMKYADKLFKLFQRLHTQQEFPGTGLGLANAQKIMALHEGQIKAHAVEGEGSVFSFCVPRQAELIDTP
ncbi:MAG: ATP-binding protein [Bacteroidia bacterium]